MFGSAAAPIILAPVFLRITFHIYYVVQTQCPYQPCFQLLKIFCILGLRATCSMSGNNNSQVDLLQKVTLHLNTFKLSYKYRYAYTFDFCEALTCTFCFFVLIWVFPDDLFTLKPDFGLIDAQFNHKHLMYCNPDAFFPHKYLINLSLNLQNKWKTGFRLVVPHPQPYPPRSCRPSLHRVSMEAWFSFLVICMEVKKKAGSKMV